MSHTREDNIVPGRYPSAAVIAIDKNWRCHYMNKAAERILGADAEALTGVDIWEASHGNTIPVLNRQSLINALEQQQAIHYSIFHQQLNTWLSVEAHPSADGLSILIHEPIAMEEPATQVEQLRSLLNQLQNIREEERYNMAREIHDRLGQQLTGIKMDISWLNKKLPKENADLNMRINDTVSLVDEAIKTMRKISSDLRPGILDDLGLAAALEWQTNEWEKSFATNLNFINASEDLVIPKHIATTLFRIYQESGENILEYNSAENISSELTQEDNSLVLLITDDGKSFDANKWMSSKSTGLQGLQERALSIGGKYEVTNHEGQGSTIKITVAYPFVTTDEKALAQGVKQQL